MNKTELIEAVAKKTELPKTSVTKVVDALFSADGGVIADTLAAGGKVSLIGFGSFESRKREARSGKNPLTGEALTISARKTPAFKAGKSLKDYLN